MRELSFVPAIPPWYPRRRSINLFNKRRGPMATIRGHDLQLQSVQKIMTKTMLPLVRLADSFLLAEVETPAMPRSPECLFGQLQLARQCIPTDGPHAQRGLRLLYQPVTRAWSKYLIHPQSSCLGIWTPGWRIWIRRQSWGILCSLPLLPSLPRFLYIPVQERAMCLVLPPEGPIPASLRPPRLQKTCFTSPQWTTCQQLRGNNPEEGSCTPTRQKVNTFLFPPLVVDQVSDVSRFYETWADITTRTPLFRILSNMA